MGQIVTLDGNFDIHLAKPVNAAHFYRPALDRRQRPSIGTSNQNTSIFSLGPKTNWEENQEGKWFQRCFNNFYSPWAAIVCINANSRTVNKHSEIVGSLALAILILSLLQNTWTESAEVRVVAEPSPCARHEAELAEGLTRLLTFWLIDLYIKLININDLIERGSGWPC